MKTLITCLAILMATCSQTSSMKDNATSSTPPDGEKIYKISCGMCHGPDGKLGINNATDLTKSKMPLVERIAIITNGRGTMTPMNGILSKDEIYAVAEYSMTLK